MFICLLTRTSSPASFVRYSSVLKESTWYSLWKMISCEMIRMDMRYQAEVDTLKNILRGHRKIIHRIPYACHLWLQCLGSKSGSSVLHPRIKKYRLSGVLSNPNAFRMQYCLPGPLHSNCCRTCHHYSDRSYTR